MPSHDHESAHTETDDLDQTSLDEAIVRGREDRALEQLLDDEAAKEERRLTEPARREAREQLARLRAASQPVQTLRVDTPYAGDDLVGQSIGIPGAGILGYLVGDQLHPPMVADDVMWSDGERWERGARAHTRAVLDLLNLKRGSRVIDIGCGVGGPARQAVDEFKVHVIALTNSPLHASTAQMAIDRNPQWSRNIDVLLHDCQQPFPTEGADAAFSLNMIYHIADRPSLLRNAFRALRPGGRLVIDDWMLTNAHDIEARSELKYHFQSEHFAEAIEIEEQILTAGFRITEVVDVGHVGRAQMNNHFHRELWRVFAPRIIANFPEWGSRMVQDFATAVLLTIRLYNENRLTYRRIGATRP